ncbi:MAG: ferritin-like domain-containing protein [Ignavibacteriales bacterium]|nr:MAG: ferritin-like domain-containing protein [Ignavibacteriales bacterium]
MEKLVTRFYGVLLSIYIYNEYTGYMELEKLLAAINKKYPEEKEFIAAVRKHIDDERKHYMLFKNYFTKNERIPFFVSDKYGYIDLFVKHIFKVKIKELDQNSIINNNEKFFKLCRLIMMTELRGLKQVKTLLNNNLINKNESLLKIFKVIEKDEPSHCYPYQYWLKKSNSHMPRLRENLTDLWIHYSLMIIKVPFLLFNGKLKRRSEFY